MHCSIAIFKSKLSLKMNLTNQQLLQHQAFINGEWVKAEKSFEVKNPYDNTSLGEVADLGAEETKLAIEAAENAFIPWKNLTASKRSRILKKWCALQHKHKKDLATILTLEQGKPYAEALGEIVYGASFVEWFAEEAKRVYGDVIPGHGNDKRITIIKQAIGVVGAITPWNFPSAMITRKVAPALAAGCTVVLKPSELTPFSALALAKLAEEAGIPPGVFNVVTSAKASIIGQEFCSNPKVKKISFTGSTRVGKILLSQAAEGVKKVSLELGGNAPFIVFDDASIEEAVAGCVDSKFRNAGQTCICTNRIFVQEGIYDAFISKLIPKVKALKTGSGMEVDTKVGPLINMAALESTKALLNDALSKGAKMVEGGNHLEGLLFEPTILSEAQANMDIFKKEIFGPIAAVYKFQTEDEVIRLANDTNYGLAAYFYGRDYARIWRVAEGLEYGMVGINTTLISSSLSPFGGVKESGFGREGSKYGISEYLNIKSMVWKI